MSAPTQHLNLIPTKTIGGALTGLISEVFRLPMGMTALAVQAAFLYGAGGTSAKAWVQTSLDGGVTWVDIMCFAFTTAAATKVSAVRQSIALAAAITPTDGTMSDNTILDGLIGDLLRVKLTTVGTYTGATSLAITAVPR
jgi:hypothetical protein